MADVILADIVTNNPDPNRVRNAYGLYEPYFVDIQIQRANTGGMGFRYETGVITVTAYEDRVDVTTDRLIVYNGSHAHNAPNAPFDIGTPELTADELTLQIPIVPTAKPTTRPAGFNQGFN